MSAQSAVPASPASLVARELHAEVAYRRVAESLTGAGVEHVLLKGPHLATVAYPESWRRAYSDLDVLVRPSSTIRAVEALRRDGFGPALHDGESEQEWMATYDRALRAPNGWYVEVHSSLAPHRLYRVNSDELFRRAVPFLFGRTPALGLAPEDLLLHLTIHAAKSHYRAIEPKHVEDVRRVVDALEIDWMTYAQRAAAARCTAASWVMLTASGAWGAVDREAAARMAPSRARQRWIRRWLSPERFPMLNYPGLPRDLMRALLWPAMVDSWRPAAAAAGRLAATRVRRHLAGVGD